MKNVITMHHQMSMRMRMLREAVRGVMRDQVSLLTALSSSALGNLLKSVKKIDLQMRVLPGVIMALASLCGSSSLLKLLSLHRSFPDPSGIVEAVENFRSLKMSVYVKENIPLVMPALLFCHQEKRAFELMFHCEKQFCRGGFRQCSFHAPGEESEKLKRIIVKEWNSLAQRLPGGPGDVSFKIEDFVAEELLSFLLNLIMCNLLELFSLQLLVPSGSSILSGLSLIIPLCNKHSAFQLPQIT